MTSASNIPPYKCQKLPPRLINMSQDLFPIPSSSSSSISPRFWPGVNPSSTETLRKLLKDNHDRWHVYFDPRGFHNHAAHALLAKWSLGAGTPILEAVYELDCKHQMPAFDSPEPITIENFKDHLGDHNYFKSYRIFFTEIVNAKGLVATLEEYVFDTKMNLDPERDTNKQPGMLIRFLDGLVHPMIHVGFAFEFGLPGMLVEGLASTSIHKAGSSALLTPSFFKPKPEPEPSIEMLTSHLYLSSALKLCSGNASFSGVHAFSVLARILKDPRFDVREAPKSEMRIYRDTMAAHGEALGRYASEWTINMANPNEVERKVEELAWTMVIVYGIAGWTEDADFNADFYHAHFVTSSLFLSSISAQLKPSSQELLLRGYFAVCLAWWVARGRPGFNIPKFFAADTGHPIPSGPLPIPSEGTLPSTTSPLAVTPNPWLPILETAVVHPDDHLPKLQRTLAHYASLYGLRAPGQADFANTELPDADKLDGTLFLRVAGLTAKRTGRVREGEGPPVSRYWDRKGFYEK